MSTPHPQPHGANPFGPPGPQGPAAAPPPFPGPAGGPAQQPYGAPGQQPYGAPPPAGQPFGAAPGPQPYGMAPAAPGCRFCGAQPAVETTIRAHRGYVLAMSNRHIKAPFCRNCGLAEYRRMQADTLKFGWWSPLSLVVAPLTMLYNVFVPKRKLEALPHAGGGMAHQPHVPQQRY